MIVNIYAEEWVQLTADPVVKMVSEDLAGVPVDIVVHRRQIPCTIAVISGDGQAERSSPEAHPEG